MALPFLRGAVVVVASPGAYSGKPRPAVVLQATRWCEKHPSLTLCPITSTLVEAPLIRIPVLPSAANGLRKPSQLMVDRLFTVPTASIGAVVGQLAEATMAEVEQAVRGWLDLG